ncbi:hypothetical protein [Terrihabitans soli]|nr:hypothetical protein [Terrihabitans soli]
MRLDKKGEIYNEERYRRYLETSNVADQRQNAMLRSVIFADGLLILVVFGASFKLPMVDVAILNIPAAREILTWWASIAFFFTCIAFINTQSYSAILDVFYQRTAKKIDTDPDFIGDSEKHFDFLIKLYRKKYNIWGPDVLTPSRGFVAYGKTVVALAMLAFLSIPAAHLAIVTMSLIASYRAIESTLLLGAYVFFILVLNIAAIFMVATMNTDFQFEIDLSDPEDAPAIPQGVPPAPLPSP